MAHNIKIYFFLYEVCDDKYWWVISYEIVVRIIYLKGLFPQPNVSKFHLLSYLTLTPFISHYRYIKGIIGVEILGRQQLRIILWNWGFCYYFYDIKHCIGELFSGCFCLWWIRALTFVMRFKVAYSFYLIFLWIIQIK